MRICCFPFLCFGEGEEDNNFKTGRDTYYLPYSCKGEEHMEEGVLGKESEGLENDDLKLRFWETFNNVVGVGEGEELGPQVRDEKANYRKNTKRFNFDGEKSEDLLGCIKDVEPRCAITGGGSQGVKVDVNLNLGLGGEPSTSSSSTIAVGRENCNNDRQNKRPKVHSFSL